MTAKLFIWISTIFTFGRNYPSNSIHNLSKYIELVWLFLNLKVCNIAFYFIDILSHYIFLNDVVDQNRQNVINVYFESTWSLCSLNTFWHCIPSRSQTRTVRSALLDTNLLPSGENATDSTQDAWPERVPAKFAWALKNKSSFCDSIIDYILQILNV